MTTHRRDRLWSAARSAALTALGAHTAEPGPGAIGEVWAAGRCGACERACRLRVLAGGALAGAALDPGGARLVCPEGALVERALGRPANVAGLLLVSVDGAGPRVASRLVGDGALELVGGDGDAWLAAVWSARGGESLAAALVRLLAEAPELRGAYAAFVGGGEPA